MTVKTRVSIKQYVKLLFQLTYRKPMMKVIVCVDVVMLCWISGYYSHTLHLPKPTFFQFTTLALITVVQPIVIYTTVWKNYYSNNHLREALNIEFTTNQIKITGDSFYTELSWAKIYRVDELKKWYLIYQNTFSAIIIPKVSFKGNQAMEFRELLQSIPDIKVHLRKSGGLPSLQVEANRV